MYSITHGHFIHTYTRTHKRTHIHTNAHTQERTHTYGRTDTQTTIRFVPPQIRRIIEKSENSTKRKTAHTLNHLVFFSLFHSYNCIAFSCVDAAVGRFTETNQTTCIRPLLNTQCRNTYTAGFVVESPGLLSTHHQEPSHVFG